MNIDIQHIAKLSRLSIPAEKVEKFQRDMEMELRKDEIRPSLRREVVLQNAPKAVAGCIVVPKTVE